MCACPAHRALVACPGCYCVHDGDRLRQWKERAEQTAAEYATLRAVVQAILDEFGGSLIGGVCTILKLLKAALAGPTTDLDLPDPPAKGEQ